MMFVIFVKIITIGQMVYQFLTKLDWFSTLFPRIPVPIQKQIEKKIETYCRENNVTIHQLSTGSNLANNRANRADFESETDVHTEIRDRWRNKSTVTTYKSEHDDRDEYRATSRDCRQSREYKSRRYESRYSSPESVYRGTSRERERYREKHKKKHKHKHHSRSRSPSRSHSRSHSERKRSEHYHYHRSKGYTVDYSEEKRYR